MNDILNRLHMQCGSDLHDGFVRSLFSEAAVEIERLRRDAERYSWLRNDPPTSMCVRIKREGYAALYTDGAELDAAIDAAMQGAND